MRILMVTTKRYPPQFYGGAEISTHSMSLALQAAGHQVAVLAGLAPSGLLAWRNRIARKLHSKVSFPADQGLGYPVFRGWQPQQAVDEMIERYAPDVIFAQSGEVMCMAEAFAARSLPVCVFLRHTHYRMLGGSPRRSPQFIYFANSRFCAQRYQTDFGLECQVLTPLVIADLYRTPSDRSRVVYVNPSPMKGIDLVLALAAQRPDIPFDIVESWALPHRLTIELKRRARQLPNVRWLPARQDMREVYRHAKLLLAPSGVGHPEWVEAWGRVATEAQFSGIPVLASNSGGLPEAVGPGGLVLDTRAPLGDWLAALSRLWDDAAAYRLMSAAATAHAGREDIAPERQMRGFSDALLAWLPTCRQAPYRAADAQAQWPPRSLPEVPQAPEIAPAPAPLPATATAPMPGRRRREDESVL